MLWLFGVYFLENFLSQSHNSTYAKLLNKSEFLIQKSCGLT